MFQSVVGKKPTDTRKSQRQTVRQKPRETAGLSIDTFSNQAQLQSMQKQADGMTGFAPLRPSQTSAIQRKCACDEESKKKLDGPLQTKLAIGSPNDSFEQEADQVADQVMRMPDQSSVNSGDTLMSAQEDRVQFKSAKGKSLPNKGDMDAPASVQDALMASGQPLPAETRAFLEPRFGIDFSGVRVHTDAKAGESARALNALAYTVGQDVAFQTGYYAPHTQEGKRLLAHELTHVVQQSDPLNRTPQVQRDEQKGAAPAAAPAPVGPVAAPKIPGPDLSIDPSEAKKQISELAKTILAMENGFTRDMLVHRLRNFVVRIQPVLPNIEAKNFLDDAMLKGAEEGIKAAVKKVLEAVTGKSAADVSADIPSHSGIGPESSAISPKFSLSIPIPGDLSKIKQVSHNSYDIKDLPKTTIPEAFFDFTLIVPDKFDSEQQGGFVLIYKKGDPADAEPRVKKKIEGKPTKNQIAMSVLAPNEPGQYVIKIRVGFYTMSDPAPEITVEKKATGK